jgi:SAM-dependent methyltransferase
MTTTVTTSVPSAVTTAGTEVPVALVFASALGGDPCRVVAADGVSWKLPVEAWLRTADAVDEELLDLCSGPTLDVGCGPGRMAEALVRRGRVVLGIDVVPEAVRLSTGRGVVALVRDVFHPMPGEGRWGTALLADGNIGIGGDPVALLERLRQVVAPGGRVVVEVSQPGTGVVTRHVRIETQQGRSSAFPWTLVGADAIEAVAGAAAMGLDSLHRIGDRWCAVLTAIR